MDDLIERMSEAYWNAGIMVAEWQYQDEDQKSVVRQRMAAALAIVNEQNAVKHVDGCKALFTGDDNDCDLCGRLSSHQL